MQIYRKGKNKLLEIAKQFYRIAPIFWMIFLVLYFIIFSRPRVLDFLFSIIRIFVPLGEYGWDELLEVIGILIPGGIGIKAIHEMNDELFKGETRKGKFTIYLVAVVVFFINLYLYRYNKADRESIYVLRTMFTAFYISCFIERANDLRSLIKKYI